MGISNERDFSLNQNQDVVFAVFVVVVSVLMIRRTSVSAIDKTRNIVSTSGNMKHVHECVVLILVMMTAVVVVVSATANVWPLNVWASNRHASQLGDEVIRFISCSCRKEQWLLTCCDMCGELFVDTCRTQHRCTHKLICLSLTVMHVCLCDASGVVVSPLLQHATRAEEGKVFVRFSLFACVSRPAVRRLTSSFCCRSNTTLCPGVMRPVLLTHGEGKMESECPAVVILHVQVEGAKSKKAKSAKAVCKVDLYLSS